MLKIHQLFLRSYITLSIITTVILSVIIYFWSKNIYLNEVEKNLLTNINVISTSLDNLNNIETKLLKIREKTGLRITLISLEGKVLAETHQDKESMENHGNRKEIIQAQYNNYGISNRYSETIQKRLLYIAKEVTIGNKDYYLRLSRDIESIQHNFIKLAFQIIIIFLLFIIVSFFVSYSLSKKIQNETDEIMRFLINLTKKKTISKLEHIKTQEFYNINRLLNKVAMKLSKKEKQKAKHTAKLKLANRQKDEIISAISHEFKNPIAIITGYVQTIQSDKDLPESLKSKFLSKIDSNANKMSMIIDKLRLTLKLEDGKEKIEPKELNLYQLCEGIISDLNDKYPNRDIELEGSECLIKADDTLISIAISNLIENALKYSEDTVTVKLEDNKIRIIDKGIGISENELNKITNKFYRVSQNDWNNSMGLGLFIVNTILSLHKFELKIKSVYNEGSEFIINY